jgi:putative ABC transport system ATP-binding protein
VGELVNHMESILKNELIASGITADRGNRHLAGTRENMMSKLEALSIVNDSQAHAKTDLARVASVETAQVTKSYRIGHMNYPALAGVSLRIDRGELTSIVGPSGSGKSTLLNIIGALDRPTSGQVRIDGISLRKLSDDQLAKIRNKKIGFIYQSFNLISRLTAAENVEMPLITRQIPKAMRRDRAIRLLSAVGLAQKAHKRPTELSGGEQQRVAVARALVTKPAIVIADEPTGNLDSKTTIELLNYVVEVNRTMGTTFVIVTHNPEVSNRTHRVITLRDGKVEKDQRLQRIDSYSNLSFAPALTANHFTVEEATCTHRTV